MQEECLETMERLVVNYGAMEAEPKPFGSQEEVGDVVEAVEAVKKHTDSWPYLYSGVCVQKDVIAGCKESREWGGRWGCRRGLRGLLLGDYTLKYDALQMISVVPDYVAVTRRHQREEERRAGVAD